VQRGMDRINVMYTRIKLLESLEPQASEDKEHDEGWGHYTIRAG